MFDVLNKEWRKVMRRVWGVPPRTHCNLIPHIAECTPPEVFLYQRFIGFFASGINSENDVVSSLFHNSILYPTRLGRNLCCILDRANHSILNIKHINGSYLKKSIVQQWGRNVLECNIYKGQQIRELVLERDSLSPWILSKQQCQDIITILCTE
jgi:hypothetical protein